MHSKKRLIRTLILLLCVVSLSAGLRAAARETVYSCDYVKITEDGFVADSFLGVEARYNLTGPTLYCNELIPRFCRQVYGVKVTTGGGGPRVADDSGYHFEEVGEARSGDVLFSPAALRGKSYNHWAICKSTDPEAGTMTLLEQNWRWNGCAGVNRVIPLRGGCYRAFRLVSGDGAPATTLAEREAQKQAELAAQQAAQQAALLAEQQRQREAAARMAVVQVRSDLRLQALRAAAFIA